MLKGKNNDKLKERKIEGEFHLFYQLWQELVNDKTLDTYQYKILYSLKAVEELIEVLEKNMQGVFSTHHHVEACGKETLKLIREDPVLFKHYPHIYHRLIAHLGKSNKEINEQRILKHELLYVQKIVEKEYYQLLLDDLWTDIKEGKQKEVIKKTGILISYCIAHGWSAKALHDKVNELKGAEPMEEKWNRFVKAIECKEKREFCVLIKWYLKGNVNAENVLKVLDKMGVKNKNREAIKNTFLFIDEKKLKLNENGKYLVVNVKAYDSHSAAAGALQKISDALNMISFYGLIESWNIKDIILFTIDAENQLFRMILPQSLYTTYDYLDSSSRIFESTQKIFTEEKMKLIQNKLNGVFSYANLSKESLFQEEKYINAWVALESLARTDMYKDIISNVLENVPAALCLRYVYRLVRNFIEDCTRCEVDLQSLGINIMQPSKQKMVQEMFGLLRDKNRYLLLLEQCKVNQLLEIRCEEIRKMVTELKVAGEKVLQHYENVQWQLQRLYRFRNEIAHSALRERSSLIIYIEHLYDYLMTFVSEIVTCIDGKKVDSIEQALLIIQDNYKEFEALIKDKKSIMKIEEVIPMGIIDFI